MQIQIAHKTEYRYDVPVHYALQKLRLRPASSAIQAVGLWDVTIDGGTVEASYQDHYGNHVDLVSTNAGSDRLVISAMGMVETYDKAGVFGMTYGRAPLWHFMQPTALTAKGAGSAKLAGIVAAQATELDGLHALSAAVLEKTPYKTGKTGAETSAEDALKIGFGVCQDHTHIFSAAARTAGFPTRYVSGYLMMDDRIDQDASHAWAEVHIAGLGWVGFDVSNGYCPDERYVRIAVGRDSRDAAPVSGYREGQAKEAMSVTVQVQQ